MKNINKIIVASTIFAFACSKENPDKKVQLEGLIKKQTELAAQIKTLQAEVDALDTTKKEVKTKMVKVAQLKAQTFNHFVEIQGKVETDKNVIVSAETPGIITNIFVKQGDRVRKGQSLAEIDAALIRKSIDQLKSGLELATTVFEKQERLWKENIGTEVQYLQAKANKESLEAQKATLNEQLKKARVVSPIDGYVDENFRRVGEMASPGAPAFRIVDYSGYKIVGELAETYLDKVNIGDEVLITFPDLNKEVKSKISVVGSAINTINRTFKIEVMLPQLSNQIKPNMISYLKIKDFSKSNAIVAPINTVQSSRDGQFIYAIENNKAVRKPIKVGETYGTDALILSGLKSGDNIVTFGYSDIVEGQALSF